MVSSGEVRAQHPGGLFLLPHVIAHEGVGALVARLAAGREQGALTNEQHPKCRRTVTDRFHPVVHVFDRGDRGASHVILHGVQR